MTSNERAPRRPAEGRPGGRGKGAVKPPNREPIGDVSDTDLSDEEVGELARGIEAERDA
jgi:hypothetical protein